MYKTTGKESLGIAEEFPAPGLPSYPVLFSGEHRAVLTYRIAESHREWQPNEKSRNLGGSGDASLVAKIESPLPALWTTFSQEGIGLHPLASVGLRWFTVYEVMNSPLIQVDSVIRKRHLVFQFEDSTLDIVFRDTELYRVEGESEFVLQKAAELFGSEES